MRVLVACEFSGAVRDAFIARGHDAWSCDLLPSEGHSVHKHIQNDIGCVLDFEAEGKAWPRRMYQVKYGEFRAPEYWDLLIAHPPCTALAVSGARWFPEKRADGSQQAAIDFFMALANAPIDRIAIENPISIMSTVWRKPDQIIQPWMFGHGETKATCLWLKSLPPLQPTNIVEGRDARIHKMSPGPDRWKERSRTLPGIAAAMAAQWG